jgi:hypothetical protein
MRRPAPSPFELWLGGWRSWLRLARAWADGFAPRPAAAAPPQPRPPGGYRPLPLRRH